MVVSVGWGLVCDGGRCEPVGEGVGVGWGEGGTGTCCILLQLHDRVYVMQIEKPALTVTYAVPGSEEDRTCI